MKYIRTHINEDYVSSYDSDDDILQPMDSILKEAGDEFIVDSLKEMFNDDSQQETLRKMLDLYSLISDIPNNIYSVRLSMQQIINTTLNLIDGFYNVIRNKLNNYKKTNDSVISIICYIQSMLANLTFGIIKEFKEAITNDNRFRGNTSAKSLIKKFANNYFNKTKEQFIDPMINKLEELKRMSEL